MLSPFSILEESKDMRAKLKSEGMRKNLGIPANISTPPIDLSNFQVVSVKGSMHSTIIS